MPLPPASPGRFDQDHHHATEHVDGQSTEHPLGEEARVVLEDLKEYTPQFIRAARGRFGAGETPTSSARLLVDTTNWRHPLKTDRAL